MATIELTHDNFQQTIENNAMVLVDFWASWCAPCRMFAPVFESVSESHPDVVFGKVNTEEEQVLAGMYQIRSIPTLMIFREQIAIFAQPGALPSSALQELVQKAKELDMEEVRRQIAAHQQARKN
jgi:thioredoxin